mmetsp:Transcript_10126/g.30326  ORF Transcript_10126/g.30326 Transcript_10126/m.30326 type:complete len:242 (+) Transcript_10126:747-1472(+)
MIGFCSCCIITLHTAMTQPPVISDLWHSFERIILPSGTGWISTAHCGRPSNFWRPRQRLSCRRTAGCSSLMWTNCLTLEASPSGSWCRWRRQREPRMCEGSWWIDWRPGANCGASCRTSRCGSNFPWPAGCLKASLGRMIASSLSRRSCGQTTRGIRWCRRNLQRSTGRLAKRSPPWLPGQVSTRTASAARAWSLPSWKATSISPPTLSGLQGMLVPLIALRPQIRHGGRPPSPASSQCIT